MTIEQELAQHVADVIVPVLTDLAALQKQMGSWESRWNDVTALRERVAVLEVRAPVPGPAGEKGERGELGMAGADGARGLDGLAGKDGTDGLDGKDGAPGLAGKDGAGVVDALIGRDGRLVLTLSDGRTKDIGIIVGNDGAPGFDGKDGAPGLHGKDGTAGLDGKDGSPGLHGKDGADGVGFDDLDLAFDNERGWLLRFTRGEQTKEWAIPLSWDAGPWQSGTVYHKGAGVMAKGCYWVAQGTTTARPGDESAESRAWRLTVKCGRDGKPGRDGRDRDPE